jgi:hypothetical protein
MSAITSNYNGSHIELLPNSPTDVLRLLCLTNALWRTEDGSVVYNCCWPSPAQSFSVPSPVGLVTIFYCLRFETSFSSPPTTRRVTVEVFDPVFTRDSQLWLECTNQLPDITATRPEYKSPCRADNYPQLFCSLSRKQVLANRCLAKWLPLLLLFRLLGSIYRAVA